MTRNETLLQIARVELGLKTLDTQDTIADYKQHSVVRIRRALEQAYDWGRIAEAERMQGDVLPDRGQAVESAEPVVARHRNGIDGAPFDVVLFTDGGRFGSRKLAVAFEGKGCVAVLDVAKLTVGDIAFGSNSWRGDQFERSLRAMIDAHRPKTDG